MDPIQAETPVTYRAGLVDSASPTTLRHIPDAAVTVCDGRITDVRPTHELTQGHDVIELAGTLVPGLVDTHIHWVQHHVRGRFQADLLNWLQDHIWPEETALGSPELAAQYAHAFFRDTARAGTTLGMAYSSAHPDALDPAFEAAIGDWLIGNTVMPVGGPETLSAVSMSSADEVAGLIERYGVGRYPITPRFALNCDADLLAGLGRLARESGAWIQTHLAESPRELAAVAEAFPGARDYTDVYDRAGLLTPRSVLGHCIHLSEREYQCLAARGCWIAHCPSSNEALDSGRMDLSAVRRHGIPFALGSDVGAGPSHSMLHVMQRFLAQQRAGGETVTASEALYRATLAGALCLGRDEEAGCLTPGRRADFVLMPRAPEGADAEPWLEELVRGEAGDLEERPLATWVFGAQVS